LFPMAVSLSTDIIIQENASNVEAFFELHKSSKAKFQKTHCEI